MAPGDTVSCKVSGFVIPQMNEEQNNKDETKQFRKGGIRRMTHWDINHNYVTKLAVVQGPDLFLKKKSGKEGWKAFIKILLFFLTMLNDIPLTCLVNK